MIAPATNKKTARPYQQQGLDAVRAAAKAGHRHILVTAPTGSGKMFVAAQMMKSALAKGNRALGE